MRKLTLCLSLLAALLLPCGVLAQEIVVTPSSWDFGDVLIGDTETSTFTMISDIDDDLRVFAVEFLFGEDLDFSVSGYSEPIGHPMPMGSSIDFYVDFTPTTLGWHEALVTVVSNDASNPIATYSVSGNGVAAPVPEPATMLLIGTGLAGMVAIRRKKRFK